MALSPDVELVKDNALPAPDAPFALRPFDTVAISVFGQPDLSNTVEIGPNGLANVPLLGRVQAGGLLPSDLERVIEDRLRGRFLRDPVVSVVVDRATSRQIVIGGQVRRPGSFAYQNDLDLSRAVALAGGLGEFGKQDDVLVHREVEGIKYIGVYNIGAIQRGNYDDPSIYPGDLIVVGDSPGRRRLLQILQVLPLVTQPLVLIDRASR
ncbi:polysaccharide biosynthesis/export family protein [Alteripontixanthobacter maritimus]|uniref:polysaccharide biosynthesis/export family protein n=1 Tax=Alteripontixanthobacter maritimus TaxID=2161824 RepID=UPI0015F07C02|nr:polysaccharide biosynthesis/export family protein [Alteripontixanthobacter maritimus]